ncbi:MAG: ABC transporter substrate-binding protein [Gammaproteobacteria bacterium]|nr:ABC transporter substrate-binding protein [Gammaproteobacteria bacterium]
MNNKLKLYIIVFFTGLIVVNQSYADYSMAIGYQPKYEKNFSHFDYVNPNAKLGGTIKLSAFGTFESLNPFLLKSLAPVGLNNLVFETLMERSLDEPTSSYGHLAEKYELAKNGLSVTFTINKNAKFSNGDLVTSFDIKHSYLMLTGKTAHPQYRIYWSDIEDINILSNRKIQFLFKRKNPELHMIIGDIPIFSRKWTNGKEFDKTILDKPIASGPYIIEDYKFGRYIIYKRNPNYWANNFSTRKGMYNFEKILFKYYKDMTVGLEAFKAGEYDLIFENHSKRWARDYTGPNFLNNKIIKREFVHKNNAGIQGFIFNTRKDMFKNKEIRKAITLAFDFDWSNKNLFYNQYKRCESYFSNSELSASVISSQNELNLAKSLDISLSKITTKEILPTTNSPKSMRENLIKAKKIFDKNGWYIKNNTLYDNNNNQVEFDFLLAQKGFERILAPFSMNLKKLGIKLNYRTIDLSLYQRKVDTFDFDMMVMSYPQSQSPGNELISMFHSSSSNKKGTFNLAGIADKDIDKVIEKLIYTSNREEMITAAHLLDRLLWNQYYLLPNWYINKHRVAYYDKFKMPDILPEYYEPINYVLKTWYYE